MMELTEKTLESREIFRGRIVTLKVDKIELPDGHQSGREVVEHPGGVAVLPLDDQDMVTLVRQYRYPFGKVLTELPAGALVLDLASAPGGVDFEAARAFGIRCAAAPGLPGKWSPEAAAGAVRRAVYQIMEAEK